MPQALPKYSPSAIHSSAAQDEDLTSAGTVAIPTPGPVTRAMLQVPEFHAPKRSQQRQPCSGDADSAEAASVLGALRSPASHDWQAVPCGLGRQREVEEEQEYRLTSTASSLHQPVPYDHGALRHSLRTSI
eukprot:1158309-Pelagomonas_calceolata.AAC.4